MRGWSILAGVKPIIMSGEKINPTKDLGVMFGAVDVF
jgi:hypothetical protein